MNLPARFAPPLAALLLSAGALGAQPLPADTVGDFAVVRVGDADEAAGQTLLVTLAPPDGRRQGALVWRCMDDGLNVMYAWDRYFLGDGAHGAEVRFAFGADPLSPATSWPMAVDHAAAFLPLDQVSPFTLDAVRADTVRLHVRDADGEELADDFGLRGLAAGLEHLDCAR